MAVRKIVKHGKGCMVTIPKKIVEEFGIKAGDKIYIYPDDYDEKIIIEPISNKPSLEEQAFLKKVTSEVK